MNKEKMMIQAPKVANLLKLLGHNKRLMLICYLFDGPKTVSELEQLCEISQSQMSQFLKRFELEGLLSSIREGKNTFYKLEDQSLIKLMHSLQKIYC